MSDEAKEIRARLDLYPGAPRQRLVKVVAGDVAAVCQSLPPEQRSATTQALLKGALSVPPAAEVWQQYGDLTHLLTAAGA